MRKLAIATIAILSISCSPFLLNLQGYSLQNIDLETAWKYTSSFKYIPDTIGNGFLKSPIEFERDGGGDCEDFCMHLMYQLGCKSSMVAVYINGSYHAIVYYDDKYIEPQKYNFYFIEKDFEIIKVISFYEAIKVSTNYGMKITN